MTAEQRLDQRLLAAARYLNGGGWDDEALDLYMAWRHDRWRLLVEYLELMSVAGYPAADIALVRDL